MTNISPEIQEDKKFKFEIDPYGIVYGFSYNQIAMMNGHLLHDLGYTGQGMLIAIIDAGFINAHMISSLNHIWDENRILVTKDFVKDSLGVFKGHAHGTIVFSAMGGFSPPILIGTAPDAEYALIRTEDGNSEYLIEEYNWLCGAEFADSIGADVINSSLGYTQFDDPSQNHSYSDMNGRNTPAAIAATIAARKGIIVVCSAGNSADEPWLRIGTPADADSILAVGATDSAGRVAFFSSRGPSYDGRVKPDVSAQGLNTVSQATDDYFVYSSGTSIASPLIAGMATCLWQANPYATNMEIIEAIKKAGRQFFNSDSLLGYGIPNFIQADRTLVSEEEIETNITGPVSLSPNPVRDYFSIQVYREGEYDETEITYRVYDLLGRLCGEVNSQISGEVFFYEFSVPDSWSAGLYYLQTTFSGNSYTQMFLKY